MGIPKAFMYSLAKYSLIDDLKTARPSACLEYGVNPAPFNYNSFKFPSLHYKSPKIIALPSPNYPAQLPN